MTGNSVFLKAWTIQTRSGGTPYGPSHLAGAGSDLPPAA
jgi:hypothetical protein